MAEIASWGWLTPPGYSSTESGDTLQVLDGGLIGTEIAIAPGGATLVEFGDLVMVDGNDDDILTARSNSGIWAGSGDRLRVDGVDRIVEEVSIYTANLTYTTAGGDSAIRGTTIRALRLGNGSIAFMLTDASVDTLERDDFYIERVTNIEIQSWDQNEYGGVQTPNFDEPYTAACFTRGTLILTGRGEVPVDCLQKGDLVVTRDAGLQPIRWIGSTVISADVLDANPKLKPVRIRAGALGHGAPAQDLEVSPQHRVLVRSRMAQRLFGTDEVLVAAKQLLELDGIEVVGQAQDVEYFHILFDDHQVVVSNGAETESLYTGPGALNAVGSSALEEIFAIFPDLGMRDADERPSGARLLLNGRQGRDLARRHARKAMPLLA